MKILYQNFDALTLSFQCAVPEDVLMQLAEAKMVAQAQQRPVTICLLPCELQITVHYKGVKGTPYQFHTGPMGAIYMIRENQSEEGWNVTVKSYALSLAVKGYEQVRHEILDVLQNDLNVKGPYGGLPIERISRVDYCIDFLIDAPLHLSPENFQCHNRTKKSLHGNLIKQNEEIYFNQVITGNVTETITLGKMPNRQVCFYNKGKEINVSQKEYYFDIWEIDKNILLDDINKKEIWRLEIRAGKKELNKRNIKRFSEFHDKIKYVFINTLKEYQFVNVENKNELNPIWVNAIKTLKNISFSYSSNADKEKILEDLKNQKIKHYTNSLQGHFIGYAALKDMDISEIPAVLEDFGKEFIEDVSKDPEKYKQKHNRKISEFSPLNKKEKSKS